MHNIYIDGSYDHSNKLIGIGIYNSTTMFELAMVKDGKNVSEAEYEKLREILRMGLTEEQGIVAIKQWLNGHDPVQQQPE